MKIHFCRFDKVPRGKVVISITASPLSAIKWDGVEPNSTALKDFQSGAITWEQYKLIYESKIQLRTVPILEALDEIISIYPEVYMPCYCADFRECHRSLLADFVRDYRPDIQVTLE